MSSYPKWLEKVRKLSPEEKALFILSGRPCIVCGSEESIGNTARTVKIYAIDYYCVPCYERLKR